ncbi:MAG TPA: NAD-dependent epimerase/dehydratase family protein [Thermoanaerobaculia bacterium]|nr:NAD-dependent epimerase/dehydratase family protein [Thermoanaerobaculia bacterium]
MPIPQFAKQQALVTGGAGFIGSHLVDRLLELGAEVRVLDDLSTGRSDNLAHLGDRVELVVGDIRDLDVCRAACAGTTWVFHQAALGSVPRSLRDPATSIAVNVAGTANVLAAARDAGVRRVVYASSSSVYGDSGRLPKREGEEGRALSPYAASKRMCEELGRVFAASLGLETVGLRYFNIYGPRQDPAGPYAAVIPRFFAASLAGESAVIHGDGQQSRDFTFVADAVTTNLLAAGAPAEEVAGLAFNAAAGGRATINQLARTIADLVGDAPPPVHTDARLGDVRHSQASLTRARAALEYEPAWDLRRGLASCLEHYRAVRPAAAG